MYPLFLLHFQQGHRETIIWSLNSLGHIYLYNPLAGMFLIDLCVLLLFFDLLCKDFFNRSLHWIVIC